MHSEHFSIDRIKRTDYFTMTDDHIHDNYELYFLMEGARRYFIHDRTYHVRKGDIVLIDRFDLHRTADLESPGHERIVLNFKPEMIRPRTQQEQDLLLLPFQQGMKVLSLNMEQQNSAETMMLTMLNEAALNEAGSLLFIESCLTQLLLLLSRATRRLLNRSQPEDEPSSNKMDQTAEYINRHYQKPLTLESLARHSYISTYYLSRKFKKHTGFTIIEYIQRVRVKEAQRLLRTSQHKVIDIAQQVGFENVTHFNRVFKKITHLTPLYYRKIGQN